MKNLSEMLQEAFVYGGNMDAVNHLINSLKGVDLEDLKDIEYFENILTDLGDSYFKGKYKIEEKDVNKYKNSQVTRYWAFRFTVGLNKVLLSCVSANWGSRSDDTLLIYADQEILCTVKNGKVEPNKIGMKKMANVL